MVGFLANRRIGISGTPNTFRDIRLVFDQSIRYGTLSNVPSANICVSLEGDPHGKVNWPMVGIQVVSTIMIIVITLITFISHANQVLREEMGAEFTEIRLDFNGLRAEFSALRSEVHDMKGRLGSVEGILRLSAKGDE